MKIDISIPDDLFSAADALARHLGMSRSELYAAAVADLVSKHSQADVTARLDQIYATESSALDPSFRRAQEKTLGGGAW